ncbi:hypothetical protein GCM10010191_49370 [Actinomadura vinacea]|uniref:Tyr recombinase domain-containing protein n=1 Tax=Actinomadura vinacea TaxID=115336 RepID=A0ABP5WPC3_9ACTN
MDKLLADHAHSLRERVLWRLLYETAARTEEILSLNIEDLDLKFRRARVVSKGGAIVRALGPPHRRRAQHRPHRVRGARAAEFGP